ncbi:MAG: hypothetical protein QOF58_5649 [Pseudonocardiales bacterium]|jgi:hypothetical protein|nr:hypothetical protein [Pseudonocardiales bacterium]
MHEHRSDDETSGNRRTGIPEVDALIDTHEVEQRKFAELMVVGTAESTVATARSADLLRQQTAARRRWSAAKGLLTKAQKDGGADKIEAARERCERAYAEFERVSDATIAEMQQINRAGIDNLDETLSQMGRSWEAGSAVIDELSRPHPA